MKQRSLEDYSPWVAKKSDMTEQLIFSHSFLNVLLSGKGKGANSMLLFV